MRNLSLDANTIPTLYLVRAAVLTTGELIADTIVCFTPAELEKQTRIIERALRDAFPDTPFRLNIYPA